MKALLAFALAAVATPLHAHGTLPGGGGFYAGMLHPLLAWQHFLLLLALGLLLGRHPRRSARPSVAVLAVALAAGLAVGSVTGWSGAGQVILIAILLTGALVALSLPIPSPAAAALAAVGGLAIGIDTGVPVARGGTAYAAYAAYAGVLVGVLLVTLDSMALALLAPRPPYAVAVRVVGSWIVAVAVMLLALQLRHGGGAA